MEIDNEAQIRGRYWNMKKKMYAILLSLAMVAGLMPDNTWAEDIPSTHKNHCICVTGEYNHEHDDTINWQPLSEINDSIESGYYYLDGDIHTTSEWSVNGDVNLCLNGHSIICDSDTAAINIGREGILTITDCSVSETGKITHSDGKNGRGIYNIGTLNLWRGSVDSNKCWIENQYVGPDYSYDRPVDYGAGIYNRGTFNMYGGTIKNNSKNPNKINISSFGGGVYNSDTFNMYGGVISDNQAYSGGGGVYNIWKFNFSGGKICNNKSGGAGGGVRNDDSNSTFTMTGGEISRNRTERSGGGVSNSGTFNMSAGKISENVAKDDRYETFGEGGGVSNFNGKIYMSGGTISKNTCQYRGGGVYNYAETQHNTIFQMTDGSITDNKVTSTKALSGGGGVAGYATSYYDNNEEHVSKVSFTMTGGTISRNSAYNGGGIWGLPKDDNSNKGINPEINLVLSGGTISGNTAKNTGGGVYNQLCTMTLSGVPSIIDNNANNNANNLYIAQRKQINAKNLKDGAKIGITVASTKFPAIITDDTADAKYFISDDEEYKIGKNSKGNVVLKRNVELPKYTVKVNLPEGVCLDEKSGGLEQSVEQESFITDIVLLADDSHYFTNEDKIKFDNLYKANKGLYIKSFDNSKIIIAGTPIGSVEANITITDKNTQSAPKACVSAPDTWNGNGNIKLLSSSSNLEYRLKNDDEWTEWPSDRTEISVKPGIYEMRYKGQPDKLISSICEIEVPQYVKPKAETPNAVFEATGPDSGILMSVNPSMQYSTDGGATWKKITDSVVIINGVNITNGVKVIRKATEDKDESYAQTITITKADTPTGLKVETKHSVTGNYSKITGFASDKKYEYKKADKGNWTEVFGTDTGTLESGNYEVRVKAEGTALASDIITLKVKNDGTVTIKTKLDKTYDGKAVAMPIIESTNATDKGKVKFEFQKYGEPENTYTTDVPKAAGEYTLRVSVAEDDDNFAAVAYSNFTISPKLVDIKWTTPDFTFNGKEQKPTATVDAKDICEGDTLNVIVNVYDGGFRGGEHKAEADINNRNYRINSNEAFTYTIKPKKITLTANDKVKHVGEKNPRFDYTADGLVDGFEPVNIAMRIEEGESAGVYKIEVVSLSPEFNPNYEITTVDGKLTIADHTYSDTTYTWSADNTECTAVRKCTYCDKIDTETAKSKAEVTQNNSCTLPELTKYTVSFKNENGTAFKAQTKENVQTKEATGHKWDGGVQTKAPTYTDEGEMTYTCESCGATKTESIEKLKLNEYDILEGADTTHVLKVDEAHAIRVNCEVEYFLDVMVDGKTVDPKYYTVKSGSTIITFTKEFLDSLSVGDHEVKFLFTNGTAKATITVVEKQAQETKPADNDKTDINKPAASQKPAQQTAAPAKKAAINQKKATRTGDDNPAMLVLILMLLGGAGAVGYSLKRRKAQ